MNRRVLPAKARSVTHHRECRRGVGALEAGQQGRLAPSDGGDQARIAARRYLGIPAGDEGLSRDIPRRPVVVDRRHTELLPATDLLHHRIARRQRDPGDARHSAIQYTAGCNPISQNLVVIRTELRGLAALVWDATRRLEQHQTVIGRGKVDAAAGVVIGEGPNVPDRVIATQGELEAILAFLRSMTRPAVASQS